MANVTIGDLLRAEEINDNDLLELEQEQSKSVSVGDLKNHIQSETNQAIQDLSDRVDVVEETLDEKVDKVDGKVLSSNDFTDQDKDKLDVLENYDDSGVRDLIDEKVDKVDGKQLSDENFTSAEKIKLDNLQNYDDTTINNRVDTIEGELDAKVDKVAGKQLSDQNFTLLEKNKLENLQNYDDSDVRDLIDGKVDKVAGKELSDENFTTAEKQKLDGLQNYDDSDVRDLIDGKVDKVAGKGLSANDFTNQDKNKLDSLQNYDDTNILNSLSNKVDKVAGKQLSTNDFTDSLRDKLASLEGSHFKGVFSSIEALENASFTPVAGDYADVDVVGEDVSRYIWDSTDSEWVKQSGEVPPLTAAQVKSLYESNPDTNGFTDAFKSKLESLENYDDTNIVNSLGNKVDKVAGKGLSTEDYTTGEKTKLSGIAAEATKNATDAQLRDRSTHTGTQAIGTVSGLQPALDGKVSNDDSRLSDSREWIAPTVTEQEIEDGTSNARRAMTVQRLVQLVNKWGLKIGTTSDTAAAGDDPRLSDERDWNASIIGQTEAEEGTATTPRKITSQRMRQAILGWWMQTAVSGLFGRDLVTSDTDVIARTKLGLVPQSSETDTTANRLLINGSWGLGSSTAISTNNTADLDAIARTGFYRITSASDNIFEYTGSVLHQEYSASHAWQLHSRITGNTLQFRRRVNGVWQSPVEIYHSSNQLSLGATQAAARTALGLGDMAYETTSNWTTKTEFDNTLGDMDAAFAALMGEII